MIKVLIKDSNSFFEIGIKSFLVEFFGELNEHDVRFISGLNCENVSVSDIIFISMCPGEHLICIPELLARKKSIIFGITDCARTKSGTLPHCYQDIIFIPRNITAHEIKNKLLFALEKAKGNESIITKKPCSLCRRIAISEQQRLIMTKYRLGKSIASISREMKISEKTVLSHKYIIMRKFGLNNQLELLKLLHRIL